MFLIGDTVVSEDLLDVCFSCDIKICKGLCCVEGDAGAPLTKEETEILPDIYQYVKPHLSKQNIKSIEVQGFYVKDDDEGYVTPLVDKKHCSYAIFDKAHIAGCAIEKAYFEGKLSFQKPVSCHLYPVRISEYKKYDALNYHKWPICESAIVAGEKLQVPVYKFVKQALVRKYGKPWFDEFEIIAEEWKKANMNNC